MSIARSQMNRQLYNMGGEGIMQVAPQMSPEQVQGEQYRPQAEALTQDPKKAIAIIVQMLVAQGVPLEEAKKIAMQMIEAVAKGGMEEVEDDQRIEARFGGRIGYANGGIGSLVNREQYGFGSVFKSVGKAVSGAVKGVTNAVQSVAKSPIGRMALTVAAAYALGPAGLNVGAGMGTFAGGALRAGLANLAVQAASGQKINFGEALMAGGIGGVTSGLTQGTTGTDGFAPDPNQATLADVGLGDPTLPGTPVTTFSPDPFQAAAAPAASVPTEIASVYPDISGEALVDSSFDFKNTPSIFDTSAQAATTSGPSISFQPDPNQVSIGSYTPTSDFSDYFNSWEDIKSPTFQQGAGGQTISVGVGNEGTIYKPGQAGFAETPLAQRYETGIQALKDLRPMDALKQISGAALDYPMTSIAGISTLAGLSAAQPPQREDYPSNEAFQQAVSEWNAKFAQSLQTGPKLPYSARNPFYAVQAANGGRIGYAFGSVDQGIMAAPQIAQGMGMPVGNPRQNQQGVSELDYRDQGGFVPPIGVKERADDIPAMLSNNEFVFTADAVKNAGGGDPNVGAQKMYALMKRLEHGGLA